MVSIRDRHNRIVTQLSKAIYRGDVTLDQSVPDAPSADRPDIVIRDGNNVIIPIRPAGEGANIDRRLVPYTRDAMRTKSRIEFIYPLARREAPAKGRRPEGEGANIDRRLVPYHAKSMRIQSRIEFIYIYIYLYA